MKFAPKGGKSSDVGVRFRFVFCLYIVLQQYLRERRDVSDVGMVQPPSNLVGQA